jgi:hypothetical protein
MKICLKKGSFDTVLTWIAGIVLTGLGIWLSSTGRFHLFPLGTRVELGAVRINDTKEKAFSILNQSSKAIVILGWTPTCHCMQARFSEKLIQPGQSVAAYVRTTAIPPLGMRAATIAIEWHFVGETFVRTDNLVASANYVAPLLLSEERLDFGTVPLNNSQTKILSVWSGNSGGNWNGLAIAPTSDHLATRCQPNGAGFQIQAQINPRGLPTGVWKSTIRLFTLRNGTRTGEEMDVPVVARIEGPFSVQPHVLQFFEQTNPALHFTLNVHSSTIPMRKLRLLGNAVKEPKIEITADGRDAVITGTLSKPEHNETFVGKIPLQINDGPDGTLQLSFIGYPG